VKAWRLGRVGVFLAAGFLCASAVAWGDENATVTGQITDASGGVVPGVTVVLTKVNTREAYTAQTNQAGIYCIPHLLPGIYRANVSKDGFKSIVKSDIELHVQEEASINFALEVGSVSETITVRAGAPLVDTVDATVSTVVDRNFADNLPLNGRSFQSLIELAPGVVLIPSNTSDSGQFSVNGQRGDANYWTVDGVSANIGLSGVGYPSNGLSGAAGPFSVLGGTNSLVSVDAMQEFRVLTSTYGAEFGRMPGAQIIIVTRSGTNRFHGTLFDYIRNEDLDANDWFQNSASLPKPEERQNDFGGTLGGPLFKDRTFFFLSYEGLRLRLPETGLTTVPDLAARRNALSAVQPYLNEFPLPTPGTPDDLVDGIGQFNATFSNESNLDAYSLRLDHRVSDKISLFGRYNQSPSELGLRGFLDGSLSSVDEPRMHTSTATAGANWIISPLINDDLRFNYTRTNSYSDAFIDTFGGAVPLASSAFPPPITSQNGHFSLIIASLVNGDIAWGPEVHQLQRQVNLVDSLAMQKGSHGLKFGVDYRRVSPYYAPPAYRQYAIFADVPSAETGSLIDDSLFSGINGTLLFHNLGVFAQDTWQARPRLTLTYGLRWDVDFAPESVNGPTLPAALNFNNPAKLSLAPPGTPPFPTPYLNLAPRLGFAYQLSQKPQRVTVLRGGFGVFYDLNTSEVGNTFFGGVYPFGASNTIFGGTFPLPPAEAAPPPITPANLSTTSQVAFFDPHLKLPYTWEWNLGLEQALGAQQTVSISYVGSAGRRLLQSGFLLSPNPNLVASQLIGNTATSDYDALQVQFQRRLSHGLQALASYTWAHSMDDGSAGSTAVSSNNSVLGINSNLNRGPSDFDIRHALSAALSYDVPAPRTNGLAKAVLRGWSLHNIIQARTAPPVDIDDSLFYGLLFSTGDVRPDLVAGVPIYLYGPQYPGGKAFNAAAFTPPPYNPNTYVPLRQGDVGRNFLRGFGAFQWDFAVHRDFPLRESLKLQFRAEMFNVLNHPNFGQPSGDLNSPQFGLSTQMLGASLDQNPGGGSFSSLYQLGGPRAVQFGLKLMF
jgi:outer membrane receptor protein involved in Fe transport